MQKKFGFEMSIFILKHFVNNCSQLLFMVLLTIWECTLIKLGGLKSISRVESGFAFSFCVFHSEKGKQKMSPDDVS